MPGNTQELSIAPMSGTIGAEISGIDLSQPLSGQVTDWIKSALHEHCVVFFRGQDITLERLAMAGNEQYPSDCANASGHPAQGAVRDRMTTIALENMTESESRPLLDFLYAHAVRPEFTCRFRWQDGSVAFWDNRCCQHIAINDAGPFPRRMRRFQLQGDRPF